LTDHAWDWARPPSIEPQARTFINTADPHPARTYSYLLGGKDNFAVDRQFMAEAERVAPGVRERIRECRAFVRRVVRFLAKEAGVRQFVDIGAGLPTESDNVHQIAQRFAPESRVVYVDNDPIVMAHARAWLADGDRTIAIKGDLAEPGAILTDAETRGGIDFTQPVAVLLLHVLHFVADEKEPGAVVAKLRDKMAPGSYLALGHLASDRDGGGKVAELFEHAALNMFPRSRAQIKEYFDGFDLVEPGLVHAELWRPDGRPGQTFGYGGVGRKA
jgi:O-methyltransferase involved in polyketide biosynthesis